MLRVIGIIALVWVGFMVLGAVWDVLGWALVVGGLAFAGYVGYAALRSKSEPPALR